MEKKRKTSTVVDKVTIKATVHARNYLEKVAKALFNDFRDMHRAARINMPSTALALDYILYCSAEETLAYVDNEDLKNNWYKKVLDADKRRK